MGRLTAEDFVNGLLGHWWLADNPSRRVAGQIRWNPIEGAQLKLLGSFSEDTSRPSAAQQYQKKFRADESSEQYEFVLGEILGTQVSLHDAIVVGPIIHNDIWPHRQREILANRMFVGGFVEPSDLAHIVEVELTSDPYSAWINRASIRFRSAAPDSDKSSLVTISAEKLDNFSVRVNKSIDLTIRHNPQTSFGKNGQASMRDVNWFALHTDRFANFDEFREPASRLSDLISVAAGRYVEEDNLVLRIQKTPGQQVECTLFEMNGFGWENNGLSRHRSEPNWIFRLNDGFHEKDLKAWLEMDSRMRSHIKRLLITRHSRGMFLEDKLQNVAAVLQGLGRDILGDPDAGLALSYNAVFGYVDAPLRWFIPNFKGWNDLLKKVRNEVSHQDLHEIKFDMDTYRALYYSAYWLGLFACLKKLKISPEASGRLGSQGFAQYEMNFARTHMAKSE